MVVKKKGFTLVEIIVSLTFLTAIAFFIINAFSVQYVMLKKTKNLTANTFSATKDAEREIQEIKKGISDKTITQSSIPIRIFGRNINYYLVDKQIGTTNSNIVTFVGDEALKTPKAPIIESVSIHLNKGTTSIPNLFANFVQGSTLKIWLDKSYNRNDVDGSYNNTGKDIVRAKDPEGVEPTDDKFQWYQSRKGFNVPFGYKGQEDLLHEEEFSLTVPVFPSDFMLSSVTTTSDVAAIEINNANYLKAIGRHFTVGVSPVSTAGKIGIQVAAKPFAYIDGAPYDNINSSVNKLARLDANYIDFKNASYAQNHILLKWNDLFGSREAQSTTADSSKNPELTYGVTGTVIVQGVSRDIGSRFVSFKGNGIMQIPTLGSNNKNLAIFVVARNNGGSNTNIISKYNNNNNSMAGWKLDFLGFTTQNSTADAQRVDLASSTNDQWHVFGISMVDTMTAGVQIKYAYDRGTVMQVSRTLGNELNYASNAMFEIGNNYNGTNYSKMDIAEIIIFQAKSDSGMSVEEMQQVQNYLYEKYISAVDNVF